MPFMNEYDIELSLRLFGQGNTPNLLAGAEALYRLRQWTNANSDGWPYWKKPSNAARRLMTLLQATDRFDPADCTEKELRSAFTPVKTFLTKQGVDHAVVFPPAPEATIDEPPSLGKKYFDRVTADRELTPEDQDMIRELLDASPRGHEIHKLLVLSARHLPPSVVPDIGMSLAADGIVSYPLLDIGWLVWVPDDPAGYVESEEFAPPEELLAVQKFARDLGCDYILFDREGPVDGSLPAWGEDD